MRRRPARLHKTKSSHWWVLLLFLAIIITAFSLRQWQTSVLLRRKWRVNIVLNASPVTVVSFPATDSDSLFLVTLPESVYANVPYGYGPYRIGAIEKLGLLEKKDTLLKDSLSDLLGIVVHGVIQKPGGMQLDESNLLSSIKSQLSLKEIFSGSDRELNLTDRWLIYWKIMHTPQQSVRLFTTHTTDQLFSAINLPDGTPVKIAQPESLNRFFENTFEDLGIRTEGLSVVILNTTDVPGVGQQFARFISSVGGKIITIGNENSSEDSCSLTLPKGRENAELVAYLKTEFGCHVVVIEGQEGVDLTIRVGKSFATRWKH